MSALAPSRPAAYIDPLRDVRHSTARAARDTTISDVARRMAEIEASVP